MNKKTLKQNYLEIGFLLLISILLLVSLFFPLLKVSSDEIKQIWFSENGFEMLKFTSIFMSPEYEKYSVVLGVFSLLQIILSVIFIVISLYSLYYLARYRISPINALVINIGHVLISLFFVFYALEGIIFFGEYSRIGYWLEAFGSSGILEKEMWSATTLSYIPLILLVVFYIIYFVIYFGLSNYLFHKKSNVPQKADNSNKVDLCQSNASLNQEEFADKNEGLKNSPLQINKTSTPQLPSNDMLNIEKLKSYKQLLDDNIITQEEFDLIKKKLLKEIIS